MKGYFIATGTITNALRARDVLRKNKFKVRVERISKPDSTLGCGYGVVVSNDLQKAEEILLSLGIKILKISNI